MKGNNNPMYGRKRPDLVARNKSLEFRAYLKKKATGRKLSDEAKRKIGLASKARVTEAQKEQLRKLAFLKRSKNLPIGERTNLILYKELRQQVFMDDDMICIYHGKHCKDMTVDHIVPLAKGGDNQRWNLIAACRSSNSSKNDRYGLMELLLIMYNNWRWEQGEITNEEKTYI